MQSKILIGHDGSPNGADALELGRRLCEAFGAEAVVFSCVTIPPLLLGRDQVSEAVREQTEGLLSGARERLSGLRVRTEATADPSPSRALFELAEAEHPELTVIGSSHRGSLGRVLLGGTGQRLAEGLPCALAVAPHGYAGQEPGELRRLGVALDGGPEARAALRAAAGLATGLGACLRLICVRTVPRLAYSATPGVAAVDLESSEQRHADRVLEEAAQALPAGVEFETAQLRGDPANALAQASADLDLLVVGSRGYGPLRRTLLGAVSARLMHSCRCPLLLTPRAAGEDPLHFGRTSATGALSGAP